MKLAYYITSHGFGHGLRSCAICNCLSADITVVLRTLAPESFFNDELHRMFKYAPQGFDCGCIQSDGATVDVEKTVAAYKTIADENSHKLEAEVQWLTDNRIDCVVSDIVPFAFEAATAARVFSIAVTNFSWFDVYSEYCETFPDFTPYVENIRRQYACADMLLELTPPNPMEYFKFRKRVQPVGRVGADVRKKIMRSIGVRGDKRLGLIYIGTFGMDSIPWKNLERFQDWEFLGLYPLPGSPANFHIISKKELRYQDIIASVDAVAAKPGYGVYAEGVLNGTPLIYLPREGFAEYRSLARAIEEWGAGYCLSKNDFYALKWDAALHAIESRDRPRPLPSNGATECAREIERVLRNGPIHPIDNT